MAVGGVNCRRCGSPLPPRVTAPRLYCSERCRRAKYAENVCGDCGGWCNYESARCMRCANVHQRGLTRVVVLDSIREWVERYGIVPSALDWNPAQARKVAHPERLAEIEARHADRWWPPVGSVQNNFGSWSAAIHAAGFEPVRVGQRRRPEEHRRHLQSKRKRVPA